VVVASIQDVALAPRVQSRRTMRTSRIVVIGVAGAGLVLFVLAMTGRLPPAVNGWSTLASAWSAPSSDAGPSDGGADAAVKWQAAPLSSAQLSAPLYHATFIAACGAPADMKVVISTSVKMGRAVDVHVTTDPHDSTVEACIDRATRDLRWDASRKTDHVTVRY
jgi:hypothetical protein